MSESDIELNDQVHFEDSLSSTKRVSIIILIDASRYL